MKSSKKHADNPPLKESLERLYFLLNRRKYVDPDPLIFLYDYDNPRDIEIAAIIASSLAYGRVSQILKSIRKILDPMGKNPHDFLLSNSPEQLPKYFSGFKHRFNDSHDILCLLNGIRLALEQYGTLERAFCDGLSPEDETILPAANHFARILCSPFPGCKSFLLPRPEDGSACKRLFLALRWLVRKDDIDLGIWTKVSPGKLVVPLDTHMFRISCQLGLCARKNADIRSALEVTNAFRLINPKDPVKYDFALTRFGIHPEFKEVGYPYFTT